MGASPIDQYHYDINVQTIIIGVYCVRPSIEYLRIVSRKIIVHIYNHTLFCAAYDDQLNSSFLLNEGHLWMKKGYPFPLNVVGHNLSHDVHAKSKIIKIIPHGGVYG